MTINPQQFLDRLAIGVSGLCAIHCLFTPILLTLLPVTQLAELDEHLFHILLIWLILPSSLIAATLGCSKHKDKLVLVGIATGIFTLIVSAFWGHDLLGEFGEKAATVLATSILALSHWRNFKLCRADECKNKHSS